VWVFLPFRADEVTQNTSFDALCPATRIDLLLQTLAGAYPTTSGKTTDDAGMSASIILLTYRSANLILHGTDAMLRTSFNENEIGKVGGGNFCRLFDTATR
jgi:hypothetical protein